MRCFLWVFSNYYHYFFCHPANCGIWNTKRAYLRKVTGIRRLVYVSLLLYLFQSTSLLIYNSPRTLYGSMNSWKYCMKTLTHIDSWCKIHPGCNWWAVVMVLLYYTQFYIEFSWKINQISGNIHTKLGTLWAWIARSFWHRESITQWYHIPGYQAFISLYMCDFACMFQLLAMCVWLSISWLPWPECWEVCRFA